jgi:hypothetical protein
MAILSQRELSQGLGILGSAASPLKSHHALLTSVPLLQRPLLCWTEQGQAPRWPICGSFTFLGKVMLARMAGSSTMSQKGNLTPQGART